MEKVIEHQTTSILYLLWNQGGWRQPGEFLSTSLAALIQMAEYSEKKVIFYIVSQKQQENITFFSLVMGETT